jgi:anti-anti-sigma factor
MPLPATAVVTPLAPRCPPLALAVRTGPPGTTVLCAEGELDLAGAPAFTAAVRRLRAGDPALLIDLSGLAFIDGAGLRAVLDAVGPRDGPCTLLATSPPVDRVVDLVAQLAQG